MREYIEAFELEYGDGEYSGFISFLIYSFFCHRSLWTRVNKTQIIFYIFAQRQRGRQVTQRRIGLHPFLSGKLTRGGGVGECGGGGAAEEEGVAVPLSWKRMCWRAVRLLEEVAWKRAWVVERASW
jgi:hypothetical protein